jgi:hypothetical protein
MLRWAVESCGTERRNNEISVVPLEASKNTHPQVSLSDLLQEQAAELAGVGRAAFLSNQLELIRHSAVALYHSPRHCVCCGWYLGRG